MPGVPPDAVDNVKRLLKGIFKRGKGKKQDKPARATEPIAASTQSVPSQSQAAPPPASQAQSAAAAPPTAAGTGASAPDKNKQLPPAQDAAPPVADTETAPAALDLKSNGKEVSPATGTPAASEPVSAVEKETPPVPPPKNDAPAEAPTAPNTTATKENIAPAPSESTAPAVAPAVSETPAPAAPAATTNEVTAPVAAAGNDEKVPVDAEPPPIKTSKPAPGMSATSGPLEDFPEGTK